MMRFVLGALAFGILLVQAKPNFSGTWVWDSSSVAGSNAASKLVVVLEQTDSTLTVKAGDRTLVWQLDGSETTTKVPAPTGPQDLRLRVRWEGPRLLVEQRIATTSIIQTVT